MQLLNKWVMKTVWNPQRYRFIWFLKNDFGITIILADLIFAYHAWKPFLFTSFETHLKVQTRVNLIQASGDHVVNTQSMHHKVFINFYGEACAP
jgi:hypothetical protein